MVALPFWQRLHQQRKTQSALALINATVVRILLAALYQPVWTSAVNSAKDFVFVLIAFAALMFWKMPPWLVVIACGLAGGLFLT
ncbi:MAG: chromate transporter [[Pasteurella] aerogenes]|nr:chromate transporter [[Pasteurella] aerogenes]